MSPQLAAGANSGIQDPSLPAWPTAFGGEGSHHHHARAKRPGRPRAAKITQGDLLLPLSRRGAAAVDLDLNPSGPDQISSQPKSHPPNGRRRSPGHRQPAAHCRWRRREMDAAAPTRYRRPRTAPPPPPHHRGFAPRRPQRRRR